MPFLSRFVLGMLMAGVLAGSAGATPRGPRAAAPDSVRAEAARLETPTGTLHGTLLVPPGPGPHPVLFLHPGSGPTDRDGNSGMLVGDNDSLRMLAEALAARGIATLRVDKRGVGESMAALVSEQSLRFETYADDAAAWLAWLRADARFGLLVAGGHSEGGLIATLAAQRAGADALVVLAAPGRPAGEILRAQLRPQLPPALYAQADSTLRALERGETSVASPPGLEMLFRPSVQPYLASWLRYDPAAEVAAFSRPTLVVQGTTDLQVTVADAQALADASPAARLVVLDPMNHVLKPVPDDLAQQTASYTDPTLPLAPELVPAVVAFIKAAAGADAGEE